MDEDFKDDPRDEPLWDYADASDGIVGPNPGDPWKSPQVDNEGLWRKRRSPFAIDLSTLSFFHGP